MILYFLSSWDSMANLAEWELPSDIAPTLTLLTSTQLHLIHDTGRWRVKKAKMVVCHLEELPFSSGCCQGRWLCVHIKIQLPAAAKI